MAITNKFCNVRFDRTDEDGYTSASKWWYELPSYLIGDVAEGDAVCCRYDGELIIGTVEETAPVCKYSGHQVLTVVDKVDVARFDAYLKERERKALLLGEMEKRQALKEKLDGFEEAAGADPEMAALLSEYRGKDAAAAADDEDIVLPMYADLL